MHLTNLKRALQDTAQTIRVRESASIFFPCQLDPVRLETFHLPGTLLSASAGVSFVVGKRRREFYLLISGATRVVWCGTRVVLLTATATRQGVECCRSCELGE
jgi:hypothetical protein